MRGTTKEEADIKRQVKSQCADELEEEVNKTVGVFIRQELDNLIKKWRGK